jgi:hypothetical protein
VNIQIHPHSSARNIDGTLVPTDRLVSVGKISMFIIHLLTISDLKEYSFMRLRLLLEGYHSVSATNKEETKLLQQHEE